MTRRAVASAVSIALHPIAVLLLATGARTRRWTDVAIVAAVAAIPFTLFLVRQVRTGRWDNVDASRPEERPRLFAVALIAMAVLALVLARSGAARGVVAAAAMFLVAWLLLRWVKLSLHMACASMAAVTMLRTAPALGIALALLLPLLAWSRMTLKRHTLAEIVIGTLLGAAAGWALVAL